MRSASPSSKSSTPRWICARKRSRWPRCSSTASPRNSIPKLSRTARREAIETAAQKKVEGQEIVAPEAPEPTKVVDLLEALKASVEATKKRKAG